MTNQPKNKDQKIDLSHMSEIDKLQFLKDKLLPAIEEVMLKDVTRSQRQRLDMFVEKWKQLPLPLGVDEASIKIIQPLFELTYDMWQRSGLRLGRNEWENLGEQMSAIIFPSMQKCYFLGYEMAAGNVERKEGNDFLQIAIQPIEDFVIETTGIFVIKGCISDEDGKNIAKTIVVSSIKAGNDHIILGIDNYHKVRK